MQSNVTPQTQRTPLFNRNHNELLRRVYTAQKNNPTDGDYISLVQKDFNHINETMDKNVIIAMSDIQYKNYTKNHIKEAAFTYLRQIQAPHSKVNQIEYTNLKSNHT